MVETYPNDTKARSAPQIIPMTTPEERKDSPAHDGKDRAAQEARTAWWLGAR